MNKDIQNYSNHINANFSSGYCAKSSMKNEPESTSNPFAPNYEAEYMDCLNAMGCAKVNMDRRAIESTEYFVNNPQKVQAYVDFCDSIVERGQSLEYAIDTTDSVFNSLKSKDTYLD